MSELTDAHLTGLGRVVVNFQFLEQVTRYAVGTLITPDTLLQGRVVAGMSFSDLVDLLMRLGHHRFDDQWPPPRQEAFENMLTKLRRAGTRRNDFVHSQWSSGRLSKIVVRYKESKRAKVAEEVWVTVKDLEDFAELLPNLALELSDFLDADGVDIFASEYT